MAFLVDLWMPILLSAVAVFVVSSIVHMVLQTHNNDYGKLAGEDAVLEAMRAQNVQPGHYMFPCPGSIKEMGNPEMIEKFEKGPVGFAIVKPSGVPGMGKNLLQWFLYSVLISVFVAYIAANTLGAADGFGPVFRITGAVAVLAYATASLPDSIWKGVSWGITLKFVFDGILYGLATAAVFAWLW